MPFTWGKSQMGRSHLPVNNSMHTSQETIQVSTEDWEEVREQRIEKAIPSDRLRQWFFEGAIGQ